MVEGNSNILSVDKQVQQLLSLERKPLIDLQVLRGDVEVKKGIFSDIGSKLSKLRSSSQGLADLINSVFKAKTTTTSDKDILTATAGSSSSSANHTVTVNQLAKSHAVTANGTGAATGFVGGAKSFTTGAQSFDITTADGTTKTINVTIDASEDNSTILTNIASAINSSGLDVGASIITTDAGSDTKALVLSADNTGVGNMITSITSTTLSGELGIDKTLGVVSKDFTTASSQLTFTAGAHTFTLDNGTTNIDITVDASDTDSSVLGKIVSAVNSASNFSAAVVSDSTTSTTQRLVIMRDDGATTSIGAADISDTAGSLASELQVAAKTADSFANQITAQDANVDIDGNSVVSSSNTNTTALNGVTLNLVSTSATAVELKVSADVDEIKEKLESFFKDFNDVVSFLKDKTRIDPVTHERPILAGDSLFSELGFKLRNIISSNITGHTSSGNPNYLSEVGITVDSNGKLSISDSSKLTDALNSDPTKVSDLFSDPGFDDDTATFVGGVPTNGGIADKLAELIEGFTKAGGILSSNKRVLDDRVSNFNRQISSLEDRLANRETFLRTQFSALFSALLELSAQQKALSSFNS